MSQIIPQKQWPEDLNGVPVHLVGAKGTGMCALAELLVAGGARVSGSDVEEEFYTDSILRDLGVPVHPFGRDSLADAALLVRSAAYEESNPVVAAAIDKGLPVFTYPEALGSLSRRFDTSGIAGVHGKTTTTALTGSLLQALNTPATVVVGSAVAGFGDRSTWIGGEEYLVAETCEYRRHFLNFSPRRIVLTSIESDHQDYYPDYLSIRTAFDEYISSLPEGGELIFCADDRGASEAADAAAASRPDLILTPYGSDASGPWHVDFGVPSAGENRFRVSGLDEDFHLRVPGRHIVLDAVAALALTWSIETDRLASSTVRQNPDSDGRSRKPVFSGAEISVSREIPDPAVFARRCAEALAKFRGSRRRSEIIGEADGILFMDDYAHHPTAISATLRGLKEFHPDRRLVVDFQPHTFTRTAALFEEFSLCFTDADILLLQPIYGSAREKRDDSISSESFAAATAGKRTGQSTLYCESLQKAEEELRGILRSGDLFVTLGAGNNRPLGQKIFAERAAVKENG